MRKEKSEKRVKSTVRTPCGHSFYLSQRIVPKFLMAYSILAVVSVRYTSSYGTSKVARDIVELKPVQ